MISTLEKQLTGVKRNIPLKEYTTFKIGGKAKFFYTAYEKSDLIKAISTAKTLKTPFFVIGGGSNLLASDRGYDGLVIKMQNSDYKIQDNKINAGAGVLISKLVIEAMRCSLSGLEWAAGLPGTIGGAVFGNAKVFDVEMADIVNRVEAFDVDSGKIKNITNKECQFDYKSSIFKRKNSLIILSVALNLKESEKDKIKKKMKEHLDYRKKAQPLGLPSAGSVFINPQIQIKDRKLLKQFPELAEFNKQSYLPAGYLIDRCGLRGKRVGHIQISEKHANFIVNLHNGQANDVKKIIAVVKRKVKERFGVDLKEEIRFM